MPLEKARLFQNVVMKLSVVRYMVKALSNRGLTDLNRESESFMRDVLNIVYGYELINLNDEALNMAAIDLADKSAKLAFQVTSSSDSGKIKSTIEKFVKHKHHETYDTLMFMMLAGKKAYTTDFDTGGTFKFDHKKHVIDMDDVTEAAQKLSLEQLEKLSRYVDRQLPSVSKAIEPNSLLAAAARSDGNPPSSANSFFTSMGMEPGTADWGEEFARLLVLFERLNDLSTEQRSVIATIMARGRPSQFGGRWSMSIQTLRQKLELEDAELQHYYSALEHLGLIEVDDEDHPRDFQLTFRMASQNDLFVMLREFLEPKGLIDRAIADCNFTVLD
jgi:hypothetical protein